MKFELMTTRAQFYGASSLVVSVCILVACLWPFRSPENQVGRSDLGGGVHFGGYGTVVSQGPVFARDGWTLELWLRPDKAHESGTILAVYDARRPRGLLLRQWHSGLVVEERVWTKEEDGAGEGALWTGGIFRYRPLTFLTIASDADGTSLYIDGKLDRVASQFRLLGDDLSGRLVLANSPVGNNSWSGDLRGLALYDRKLNDAGVLRDYNSWVHTRQPDATPDDRLTALYLFDEHSGQVIHNAIQAGTDLYIPDRYLELHQAFLKRPWDEYHSSWDYWNSVLSNIAGFVPLGFLLYGYFLLGRQVQRAALITIAVGALLSLTVEILQSFLPTRDSGITDIITNTLGTALGVLLLRFANYLCQYLNDGRHARLRHLAGFFTLHPPLLSRGDRVKTGPGHPRD
jgi:VanZ family protein